MIAEGVAVRVATIAAIQGHGVTFDDVLIRSRVRDRSAVGSGGHNDDLIRAAIDQAVVDHQGEVILAILIRREGGLDGVRFLQVCGAARGAVGEGPLVGQGIAICVAAVAAVELDGCSRGDILIRPGIRDRGAVLDGSHYLNRGGFAIGLAIVDDQGYYIAARCVRWEPGFGSTYFRQRGGAAFR